MRQSYSEKLWYQTALVLVALIPVTLLARQFDDRLVNDISIWIKPLKFQVATALHLVTLAILVRFLPDKARFSTWLAVFAVLSSLAGMLEVLIIAGQSVRGVASHFNYSTALDTILYTVMGVGVLIFVLPMPVIGARFLAAKEGGGLTAGLKLGAGLGLILGFLLTLIVAGYMSSLAGSHWVGAPTTDAGGVPVFGWSRQGGDLRVAHFFATHLTQALPLAGFLADRAGLGASASRLTVAALAIISCAMVAFTFLQALSGEPFIG